MSWLRVESEIRAERDAQDIKWGEQNHPNFRLRANGTLGPLTPLVEAMAVGTFETMQQAYKRFNDELAPEGSWHGILLEEVFEAITEAVKGDTVALRKELVQSAAVIVAWIECIDRRVAESKANHPSTFSDDDALRAAGRLFPANTGATSPGEVGNT